MPHSATLRLFNAIQVDAGRPAGISNDILARTVRHGYLLHPAIKPDRKLLGTIESVIGISGEKANASFHKSWRVVRDSPMESLLTEQIIHYITTYGFEALGLFRQDAVYIPPEVLDFPEIEQRLRLVVIKALDAHEILQAITALGSGLALSDQTLDDIMAIVRANNYDGAFVRHIANRQLKARLYDHYGLVPSEPVEFLRHLVTKLTDETLLTKNDELVSRIKASNGKLLDCLLKDAPDDLASIFFRYKPLFLALKSISQNKSFFNRLRKRADKLHRPLPEDYLNSVTARIKQDRLDTEAFRRQLAKAPIFRKIRLAYALAYRVSDAGSIVYRVRNGRGWATGFRWPPELRSRTQQVLNITYDSIVDDIRPQVQGRTFYIPSYIRYTLPATERQFTGHFPTGSYVRVGEDLIVGIHWVNTQKRVDLDLSVISTSGKFGWDAAYRSGDRKILFSGDVTDAPPPRGASELFYFRKAVDEPLIVNVNHYNRATKGDEAQCKFLVAQHCPRSFDENYMVDVSDILAAANMAITSRQSTLGLVANVNNESRVYFANVSVGKSISARQNEHSEHARRYLLSQVTQAFNLNDVLRKAGAQVATTVPEGEYCDLSPEALDRSVIIDLIAPARTTAVSQEAPT